MPSLVSFFFYLAFYCHIINIRCSYYNLYKMQYLTIVLGVYPLFVHKHCLACNGSTKDNTKKRYIQCVTLLQEYSSIIIVRVKEIHYLNNINHCFYSWIKRLPSLLEHDYFIVHTTVCFFCF